MDNLSGFAGYSTILLKELRKAIPLQPILLITRLHTSIISFESKIWHT